MMQPLSLSRCSRRCLSIYRSNAPEQWVNGIALHTTRRFRSGPSHSGESRDDRPYEHSRDFDPFRLPPREGSRTSITPHKPAPHWSPPLEIPLKERYKVDPGNIPAFFEHGVERWSGLTRVHQRMEAFGISAEDIIPLLTKFRTTVQSGVLSTPEAFAKYTIARFGLPTEPNAAASQIDMIYSTIFFTWASDPAHRAMLEGIVPPSTVTQIQRLAAAATRMYPAEEFAAARKMHRKIIMHVGPTNSGKTHHALRALAASKVGVYAGPLRLLAHEIWERLNLGQIVPLGEEEGAPGAAPPAADVGSALDVGKSTVAYQRGNPKYVRKCNMVTGEEQKVVEEFAPLLSCTVEMLSFWRKFDVAVIDEIQMIADEQRGFGWTNAVLGICAKEVHLCGEERAVPLVEALLKDTGDELIVHRYNRLTPLVVEKESLNGDLSKIRKGDCIVTFSRSSIFAIKRQVEEKTGLRCAVVYGKLPPEIRSEQAALFNDPSSGYDVIIGSDAIGMGLNLKIRRIIFEQVSKWDGGAQKPLSVSQVKQIAGRAGRYGLQGNEEPGGFTTTLHEPDLPFLRKTLDINIPALTSARIGPSLQSFTKIANALPAGASTDTIYRAHIYVANLQPKYNYAVVAALTEMSTFIDTRGKGLTFADRLLYMMAPISWREDECLAVAAKFIQRYRASMHVDFLECIRETRFMDTMLRVERLMQANATPSSTSNMLKTLEAFHKSLVLYIWMSFRNPVAYSNHTEADQLKVRLERAMDWVLEGMSKKVERVEGSWLEAQAAKNLQKIPYDMKRRRL